MSDGTRVLDPVETSTITPGDTIATDDVTQSGSVAKGQKVQRVKVGFGKDGEYADVTTDNKFPFEDKGLDALLVPRFLELILEELRIINMHLAQMGEELTADDLGIPDSLGE